LQNYACKGYRKNRRDARYDNEKYRELILDAAQSVLGYFGFDRIVYGDKKTQHPGNGDGYKN
jgi:hypothetical protein